jgi:hypothetical protein
LGIGNIGSEFGQSLLRGQGTTFPFPPLLINGKQKFTQSHVPEEIPLMKVRKIMDEQLHVTGPLGQNQAGL